MAVRGPWGGGGGRGGFELEEAYARSCNDAAAAIDAPFRRCDVWREEGLMVRSAARGSISVVVRCRDKDRLDFAEL